MSCTAAGATPTCFKKSELDPQAAEELTRTEAKGRALASAYRLLHGNRADHASDRKGGTSRKPS